MKQLRLIIVLMALIGLGIQTQTQALPSVAWQTGTALPSTRAEGTAVLSPDDAILVIGGISSGGNKIVQKLVPGETVWTTAPDIDTQRLNAGVVRYSPLRILIYGGTGGGEASDEVLEYDYNFGDSQDVAKMNISRYQFAFAGDSLGNAYAIGGLDGNGVELPNVEYYDSGSDSWIQIPDLPLARFAASAVGDTNGNIFVFGGESTAGIANNVYCYSTTDGMWIELPTLPVAVRNSAAVFTEGHIFVIGGVSVDGPVPTVQVFNLATGIWALYTDLPESRYSHAALVDSSGQIVVIGGYNTAAEATSTVYHSQSLNTPETLPIITSAPVSGASLDRFYTYRAVASGNPSPILSLLQAPAGMGIDSGGLITWQPVQGQVGNHNVTVRASNRVGDTDQMFTIVVVTDTFSPTTPTSLQVDTVGTTTADLSWLAASDNYGVDHYALYRTRGCGWRNSRTCYDLFLDNIVATSVSITGLTPLSSSNYAVRAFDAAGNMSGFSAKVNVRTLSAPTGFQYRFNGQVGSPISLPAKSLLEFTLFSSANPSAVVYSLLSGPQGMLVDPTSGLVQWTPSATTVGTYTALFQATNSVGSSELSVEISVLNDAPQLSVQFNPNTGGSRYAVAAVPFTAQVSDASNTPPTFELIVSPAGMAIDATTGFITWLPSPGDAGLTDVTVRASSPGGTSDLLLNFYTHFTADVSNIQVTDLTALNPVARWVAPAGAGSDLIVGYSIVASARFKSGRTWRTEIINYDSPGTGTQFELTGLTTGRLYNLYINAYDALGERGLQNPVPVNFNHFPSLPAIGWTVKNGQGGSVIIADKAVIIQLTDSNITSLPSTYSIVNAPTGLTLDSVTGEALWTPTAADIGMIPITLRATNNVGPRDITININVLFSGQVLNASASAMSASGSASWLPPADNVLPIASYRITRHWTWSGRKRSISWNVTATSIQFSIYPTGAVSHKGISITPVDALGRFGASTPLIAYTIIAPPPPANVAPVTNAGPDQTIALPHTSVTLNGSATDDGLPNPPGAMSFGWSVVSGPGTVVFSNPSALSTTASFSIAGTYTLRLTASDGELNHQDDLIVTVNPEPLPVNIAPVSNAGLDQNITLPNNSVTLNGSATDDGLPNPPGAMSFGWSVVSGPGTVNFSDLSALSTTASFSIAGTYTLRLAVNDGEFSDSDDLIVTVSANSGTPPPYDPDAQQVELQGSIQEVGSSYIKLPGVKVWYTASTVIKFEDGNGSSFQVGQSVELKGSQNTDGSTTAKKIQVGG